MAFGVSQRELLPERRQVGDNAADGADNRAAGLYGEGRAHCVEWDGGGRGQVQLRSPPAEVRNADRAAENDTRSCVRSQGTTWRDSGTKL